MDTIERLLGWISRALVVVASICLLAMMVHVGSDVAGKYLLNQPIPGTAEIVAYYYMIGVVFLPLPFVEVRNTGISVDLFYNRFARPLRRAVLVLAFIVQALFFGVLAYQSSIDAFNFYNAGEMVEGLINVQIWPGRFFLPVGLGLAAIIGTLRAVQVLIRDDWEEVTAPVQPFEAPTNGGN